VEGVSNASKVVNKSSVKIAKIKKHLNVVIGLRRMVILFGYGYNLTRVYTNSILTDNESKKFDFGFDKFTFLQVCI
jgi:hypothetical protein